jgi:hypothetical protein
MPRSDKAWPASWIDTLDRPLMEFLDEFDEVDGARSGHRCAVG